MELFVLNEIPLDFNLICKYKEQLGNNDIKKINKTLHNFIESDLSPNSLEITGLKEETKSVKKIEDKNKQKTEEAENTIYSPRSERDAFYE